MAKGSSKDRLPVGTRVVVKDGVDSPDFPEVSFAGWTGVVNEYSGKKSDPKYVIEWDEATLNAMPEDYVQRCEEQMLFHRMACLERDQVEASD